MILSNVRVFYEQIRVSVRSKAIKKKQALVYPFEETGVKLACRSTLHSNEANNWTLGRHIRNSYKITILCVHTSRSTIKRSAHFLLASSNEKAVACLLLCFVKLSVQLVCAKKCPSPRLRPHKVYNTGRSYGHFTAAAVLRKIVRKPFISRAKLTSAKVRVKKSQN